MSGERSDRIPTILSFETPRAARCAASWLAYISSSAYVSEPPEKRMASRSGVKAACRSNSPCRA
ncbi:hypothetical protein M8C14_09275 [Bacillus subtilis subsp. subtilis]